MDQAGKRRTMITERWRGCPVLLTCLVALAFLMTMVSAEPCPALEPDEVLVVANRNAAKSHGLASFYMKQRQIPKENLVLLWMTDREACSRQDYDKKVVPPVRRFLSAHPGIRAIATVYGLPIRIAGQPGDTKGKETGAAFDSELSLVMQRDYDIRHWQPNPFYYGFRNRSLSIPKDAVMMVSRLDGPDAGTVRRIIRDSLEAEKKGMSGKAYIDARWPPPAKGEKPNGYALYDSSLHHTATLLKEKRHIPVVLDQSPELFKRGSRLPAALYCGWYALGTYIDAFAWQQGAVGYHMASIECNTLKGQQGGWCKGILENGAAATLGPVGEPYIQAFPVPEIFFELLTEGILTLAEAYTVSLPYLSWQMMLVGDPLYRMNFK